MGFIGNMFNERFVIKMIFDEVLNTFENDDIKQFAIDRINNFPSYFWVTPASSSGRYHPKISLGNGGLARHTVAVVRFLNHIFSVNEIANKYTSRERDLMRVAAIVHDSFKSGTQADYEQNQQTKFNHPLLVAEYIRRSSGLPQNELELIAHIVESHMGSFKTTNKYYPGVELPVPKDKYQIFVHLADYLASRRDIEMIFDEQYLAEPEPLPDINTWRFDFGKHDGKTIREVYKEDPGYIRWAKEKMNREPAASLIRSFVE